MSFTSWPRNSKRSAPAARRRRETPAGQRASFPARLDALEGRRLFSTLTVTSANDSGAGSLRAEIAAAQSGDTIVFAPTLTLSTGSSKPHRGGTTTTSKTITLTGGELDLTKSLTIQGPGAGQLTITGTSSTTTSHGGHKTTTTTSSQVFEVAQSTTVTLSGLTISNGNTYAGGGGIHNSGTVTVSSCTLSGHVGGAISNSGGTATVINSTVSGNNGGGIYNSGGTLTISGSSLSGNFAYSGGGIYNSAGSVTVSNSIVSGNAARFGGGIYNNGGTLTISNGSTLSGNTAYHSDYPWTLGDGGGIYNDGGTVTISNSTVSGNTADAYMGSGGGIYNSSAGTVTISNSILSVNTGLYGADVYNLGVLHKDGASTIGILEGNPAI